jgi:DNA-binding NtrC family response regulator
MGIHTLGQTASPERDSDAPKPLPCLYLLFECDRPAASSMRISLEPLSELHLGRGAQRSLSDQPHWRLQIPDGWLSSKHARLQDSFGRWILHDEGSKNGCRVNGESVQRHELQDGDLIELGRTFFIFRVAPDEGRAQVLDLDGVSADEMPITLNPELAQEVAKLEKLAETDISILILGESGSGKEVLAQHIHRASQRPGEFVPVNCGALPAGLVESELFGHKKGSFSGAVADHIGLVRKADAGTLFLDEIADLPGSAQATMLRVLQEKEVRAVGATVSDAVDLRTVSATHLDLDARVEKGDFRRDLFARIAGYRMSLPPLQRRREDMGLLIATFIKELGQEAHRFSIEAGRALLRYPWPLNIRELRSCLATATVLADEGKLELAHLPEALRSAPSQEAPSQGDAPDTGDSETSDLERQLLALLSEHQGNVSAVARSMDKDRKQIQRWIKRFGIDLERFRNA